jgi:MFS family permease
MLTVSIYIPLWFQAIKGVSAMQSGINTIPLVLSVVVGSILSGGLTQRIGYYTPFMILGSSLMAVGTGLVTTWDMSTKSNAWIGYQILLGFGVGCTMQHPNLAVQIVLAKPDVPTGTAFLSLCQTLGGAVFTAVGQNLYIDKFSSGLESIGGLDPKRILEGGATDLTDSVPSALRNAVLAAYNHSLTQGTFLAALIVACIAVPAALGMEWRSVKQRPGSPDANTPEDDAEKMERAIRASRTPSLHSSRHSSRTGEALAPPRIPPLKKLGMLASMLTVKVNPDLRDELSSRRQA